jgi:hypothetical protein
MKIYQLLASLTKKELYQLQAFLDAEWVVRNPVYKKMVAFLLPYHPHFEEVDKQDFLSQLTGGSPKSLQYLYDRSRELFQLTERFLLFTALPQQPYLRHQLKLAAYKSRGLDAAFLQASKTAIQDYEEAPLKHWKNTYNCWFTYQQLQNYPAAAQLYVQNTHPHPAEGMQELDAYYLLLKLRHSCNAIATGQYRGALPQIPYLDEMLAFAESHFADHFMIQAYRRLTLIHLEWQEDTFYLLYDSFLAQNAALEESDRLFILLSLINLINRNIKAEQERMRLMFSLYQQGTKDHLFSRKMPLSDATFLNICTVAAILREKAWAQAFIDSHHQYLPEQLARAALSLAKALLHFHSGEYHIALELCNTYPPKAHQYKSRMYFLRLRCLLELQLQDDSFFYVLRDYATAFRKYLQRNKKVAAPHKIKYRNSITAILKIAEASSQQWRPQSIRAGLRSKIDKLEPLYARKWLLQKLEP